MVYLKKYRTSGDVGDLLVERLFEDEKTDDTGQTVDDKKKEEEQEKKDEEDEESSDSPKETTVACTIDIGDVYRQMHQVAEKAAKKNAPEYKIQNTAINNDKKQSFYGPGSHIVATMPAKKDVKDKNGNPVGVSKKKSLLALKTYLSWFIGPDEGNRLKFEDLFPLSELDPAAKQEQATAQHKDEVRNIGNASSKGVNEAAEEPSNRRHNSDPESDSEAGQPEQDEKTRKRGGAEDQDNDRGGSDQRPSADQEDLNNSDGQTDEKGYYINYKLEVEGVPEHTRADALKKFFMNAIAIQGFNWRTGSTTDRLSLANMADKTAEMFGKLDPDKLMNRVRKELTSKFPQSRPDVDCWDSETILQYLRQSLDDDSIQKIHGANYAICVKVPTAHNQDNGGNMEDKSVALYNPQVVADAVNKSIKGLISKFKNHLKKDDVILVNTYNENEKNKSKSFKNLISDPDFGKNLDSIRKNPNSSASKDAMDRIRKQLATMVYESEDAGSGDVLTQLQQLLQGEIKKVKLEQEHEDVRTMVSGIDDIVGYPAKNGYKKFFSFGGNDANAKPQEISKLTKDIFQIDEKTKENIEKQQEEDGEVDSGSTDSSSDKKSDGDETANESMVVEDSGDSDKKTPNAGMLVEVIYKENHKNVQKQPTEKDKASDEKSGDEKFEDEKKDGENSSENDDKKDQINENQFCRAVADSLTDMLFEGIREYLEEDETPQSGEDGEKSEDVQKKTKDFAAIFQLLTMILDTALIPHFNPMVVCTTQSEDKEPGQEQKKTDDVGKTDDTAKSTDGGQPEQDGSEEADKDKALSESIKAILKQNIVERLETALFGYNQLLAEGDDPYRPTPKEAHLDEKDLDQIEFLYDSVQSHMQRYIKRKDPTAKKLHVNFYIPEKYKYPEYGLTDNVVSEFLKKDGLGNDGVYSKMKKMPYTILIAMKKQVRVPYANGTMRKSGKPLGTTGEAKSDAKSVAEVFKNVYRKISQRDVKEKEDFMIYEIEGKSKKIKYFFKDKKEEAKYKPEDLFATMHVYAITFKSIPYKEGDKPEPQPPQPEPDEDGGKDRKNKDCCIIAFTADLSQDNDESVSKSGHYDIYIVPMKGLSYEKYTEEKD